MVSWICGPGKFERLSLRLASLIKSTVVSAFCFLNAALCIYSVRDVGFADIWPAPYELYYFVQDDTADEIITTLKQISDVSFLDSNIEFRIINIDQNRDEPALEYLRFWELESFPSAVLVSPWKQSLVIPLSSIRVPFSEYAWPIVEGIVSSPARDELQQKIIRHYAVIVLVEGRDTAGNTQAREEIQSAGNEIKGTMSQMVQTIDAPPHLIIIGESSRSQENILLWSLEIAENELDVPYAAVFYGRGRRFGPTLRGNEISRQNIYNLLTIIGLSCECGLDREQMIGMTIPLTWGQETQSEVVKRLGFDAENPAVKLEMSQILAFGSDPATWSESGIGSSAANFAEYNEFLMELGKRSGASTISPAQLSDLATSGGRRSTALTLAFIIVGCLAILVITTGTIVLLRRRARTE